MGHNGVVRWAFNFEEWKPTEEEWQQALSLVEPVEKERIGRFRRPVNPPLVGRTNPDAKSALMGRLLMRLLVYTELGIPFSEIVFARTQENKPYLKNKTDKFPNFNFNVSHAGNLVVLGSEPEHLVGVDVMETKIPGRQQPSEFFSTMTSCFTPFEWSTIRHSPALQKQLDSFFVHWCLKESYIKAVGIGLGFELQRAQFTLNDKSSPTSARIAIDGAERANWRFDIDNLIGHYIASAVGPAHEATDAFKVTMNAPNTTRSPHDSPRVPYTMIPIDALLQI